MVSKTTQMISVNFSFQDNARKRKKGTFSIWVVFCNKLSGRVRLLGVFFFPTSVTI